jgi:hypothetical protein
MAAALAASGLESRGKPRPAASSTRDSSGSKNNLLAADLDWRRFRVRMCIDPVLDEANETDASYPGQPRER